MLFDPPISRRQKPHLRHKTWKVQSSPGTTYLPTHPTEPRVSDRLSFSGTPSSRAPPGPPSAALGAGREPPPGARKGEEDTEVESKSERNEVFFSGFVVDGLWI